MDERIETLGSVEHVKLNLYVVRSPAVVGHAYSVHCPVCHRHLLATPEEAGNLKIRCDSEGCHVVIGYKAVLPTAATMASWFGDLPEIDGVLCWGQWPKYEYKPHLGSNTIGREDSDYPSDVELDDLYISRQSLEVIVSWDMEKGYRYELLVRQAKNPVYVNKRQLYVGQKIDLAFGDRIKMGETILYFVDVRNVRNDICDSLI